MREAEGVAARITATVCTPVLFGTAALKSTAGVGLANNDGKMSSDQLLAAADAAMYEAKRTGKSRYRIRE